MSLRSRERALRAKHKRLLRQRAAAQRRNELTLAARLGRLARKVARRLNVIHHERVGTFKLAMLDGHPANINDATKRVIALAYQWAAHRNTLCTITATTDGSHAVHSYHYPAPPQFPLGQAADINFVTEEEERDFQNYLRKECGTEQFIELLGPADWAKYASGLAPGPAPGHYGANAHVHAAPLHTFEEHPNR